MRVTSLCLCGLLILITATTTGCGDDSESPAAPLGGTITINPEPNSLGAPWQIVGPNTFDQAGTGDVTLTNMAAGDYSVTWGDVPGWATPGPRSVALALGESLSFDGQYVNPFDTARIGSDITLEVMTWNIENFPKAVTTVAWVTQIIRGLQPDIVAVEEIANGASFDALISQLDGWGGVQARSDAYQNLGFLFREDGGLVFTTAYEILTSYSREFPRAPYVLEATWNGTPIVVIANHLKASGNGILDESDPYDEETRRRDACVMLAEYVAANLAGRRVFIVGDMNDELTDTAANNVFRNFLDDPANWRFVDLAIAQGPSGGWSYPGWPSHIDHILVTDELFPALQGAVAATLVVPLQASIPGGWSKYDNEVSDHLPLAVKLQFQ